MIHNNNQLLFFFKKISQSRVGRKNSTASEDFEDISHNTLSNKMVFIYFFFFKETTKEKNQTNNINNINNINPRTFFFFKKKKLEIISKNDQCPSSKTSNKKS